MRQILLVGIGQTGATVAELLLNKLNSDDVSVKALAIDTDEGALSKLSSAQAVYMTDDCGLADVVERLGEDNVKAYFPCDWEKDKSLFTKNFDMGNGSGLWRMKALLAFNSFFTKEKRVEDLHSALKETIGDSATEIYVVSSLVGGTGSALFVPTALYIKDYLRSIGAKVASTSAFLIMPDVYKDILTAEQGVKGYANAYAALRELNAINTVAFSGEASKNTQKHPPVNFKIWLSGGEEKVLFDSKNRDFQKSEAAPFDRITLLESIPTVVSIQTHISVFADIVASAVNCGTMNLKNTDTDIGSASLVKVEYPIDSIVNYISKKQLHTFVSKEMKEIAKKAEQYLVYKSKAAKNERRVYEETVEEYRDAYLSSADSVLGENKENPRALIGRIFDPNEECGDNVDLYDSAWMTSLDSVIERSITTSALNAIKQMISEHADESRAADNRKKIPLSVIKKELAEKTEQVRELLKKAYSDGQKCLNEGRASFVAELSSFESEAEFSIYKSILCEDGKAIHPVYALFKLCKAHKLLESYKGMSSLVPAQPIKEYPFPYQLLLNGDADICKSKYSKFEEKRFAELLAFEYGSQFVEENEHTQKKKKARDAIVADDKDLFFEDLANVYEGLIEGLKHYRYLTVLEVIEKLIERYRELFYILDMLDKDILSDVNLWSINGSMSTATTVSVGASVTEKETIYQTYISKYNKSIDVVAANDAVISSRVEKLILADTENSLITRRELLSALDDIESVYREHFVGTELYREKIQKDILAALKDSVSGLFGDTGLSYPKIFTARYIPLKTGPYATYDEIKATSNSVNVVLSSDIAKRIDLSVVEALVGEYCEYGTKVHFASNVDEKELFVYRESKGARFSFAEILNELASEPKGYESYVKAHKAKKNYDTPMWDPSLIYEREGAVTLPFISAEMQKKYELSVAKAVMFALSDETLFTARDDDGNSVYFVDVELERVPVCLDGEPVHEGDVVSLMRWAYSNAEWVEEYAKAYEAYADKCKKTVMSSGSASEGLYRSMLIERVALERIREPMLVLLDGLDKTDSLGVEGYADCIARTVYELVLGCCTERSGSLSESEALVYNGVIRRFFEYISERSGVQHAEKYAEWLNSQEIFMYYTVYNKFCEFKFDRQV